MSPEKLIFVYGTLKRACANHHFLSGQKFIGEARTRNAIEVGSAEPPMDDYLVARY